MNTLTAIAPTSPTASLLVQAATDPAAIAALAEVESPALRAWLTRILRDGDLAEEAVQEAWVGLLRGGWAFVPRTTDGDGDARAWLRQVALRTALNLRRSQRNAQHWHRAAMSRPTPARDPLEVLEAKDLQEVISVCLEHLPLPQRQAVVLRYHEDLDYQAIGVAQGCTALTARVRAWRGLRRLRQGLLLLGLVLVRGESLGAVECLDGLPSSQMGSVAPAPSFQGRPGLDAWPVKSLFRRWGPALATVGAVMVGGVIWSARGESPAGTESASSPWLVRKALSVVLAKPRLPLREADGKTADKNQQIAVNARLVRWTSPCPWPADRIRVLDRVAGGRMLSELAQERGCERLAEPKILLISGQSGSIEIVNELPFIAGHRRRNDVVEPCTETMDFGNQLDVTCKADRDDVLLENLFSLERSLQSMTPRQFSYTGPGNTTENLNWEEPRIRETRSLPLVAEGIRLRPGEVLLVPPGPTQDLIVTPDAVRQEPVSHAEGAWLLLSAEQTGPAAPAVPVPVGRS